MRCRLVLAPVLAVAVSTACTAAPYPTDIDLQSGDVGCEVEYVDQRWVVGPVPDGGSLVIERDLATVITIALSQGELTVRSLRGSEEGESTGPVARLNDEWSPDEWMFIDGEDFRPVLVRCWQQP